MSGKKAGTGEKGSRSRRARRGLLLAGLLAGWLIWLWAGAASADMNRLIPYYSWGSGGGTEVGAKKLGVSRDAKLPVYGAPFEEAWRGAGGRAAVSAAEPFLLLGSAQDGEWLLVSYQVDAKAGRIGWIRRPKNMPVTADSLSLERALCEIGEDCVLTDDPLGSGREIRRMTAGEQAIALLRIQREDRSWTCVETEAEGRTVWGFVHLSYMCRGYDKLMTFYGMEKNSCDTVFIGTSTTFSGIMPMDLYEQQGITSCIYATNMQFENSLKYSIREVLSYDLFVRRYNYDVHVVIRIGT